MAKSSDDGIAALLLFGLGGAALVSQVGATRRREIDQVVQSQFSRACALLGIPRPRLVATGAVPNAASNGIAILYNRDWVGAVLRRHCNDCECRVSVVLGFLAHELGHHVLEHARDPLTPSWDKELAADHVSGLVLARAGVNGEDFERLLAELSAYASHTHPPAHLRSDSLRRGYARAVSVPSRPPGVFMQIPIAHINIQNVNCIIFHADARDRSHQGRLGLLNDLTVRARNAGLAVSKRALQYVEGGQTTYFGDTDLVRYLQNNGRGIGTTHALTVQ